MISPKTERQKWPIENVEVIKKYEPRNNAPDLSTTLKESEMNPTPNTLSALDSKEL